MSVIEASSIRKPSCAHTIPGANTIDVTAATIKQPGNRTNRFSVAVTVCSPCHLFKPGRPNLRSHVFFAYLASLRDIWFFHTRPLSQRRGKGSFAPTHPQGRQRPQNGGGDAGV